MRGIITIAMFLLDTSAYGLVLCLPKKGEGTVQAREECKKNEVELDPAAVGLGAPGPEVYDSNGEQVGHLLDFSFFASQVAMRIDDTSFTLNVYKDYITSAVPYGLFFETSNCSGAAFVQYPGTGPTPLASLVAVGGANRTVYVADTTPPPQSILAKSEWINTDPSGRCNPLSTTVDVFPVSPLVDLDTLFVPPFSVR